MEDLIVSGKRLGQLKVLELQEELRCRDLPRKGNKMSLFERLGEYLLANPEGDSVTDEKDEDEDQILASRELVLQRAREITLGLIGLEDVRTVLLAQELLICGVSIRVCAKDKLANSLVTLGATRVMEQTTLLDEVDVAFLSHSSKQELQAFFGEFMMKENSTERHKLKGVCVFNTLTDKETEDITRMLEVKKIFYLQCAWIGPIYQAVPSTLSLVACGQTPLFVQCKQLLNAARGKSSFLSEKLGRLSAQVAKAANTAREDLPFVKAVLENDKLLEKRQPHMNGFLEYHCIPCGISRKSSSPITARNNFITHLYQKHKPEILQEISNAQMVLEARLDGLQGDLGATNRAVATTNRELVQTNADITYLNNKVLQLEFQLNQLLQFKRSFMPDLPTVEIESGQCAEDKKKVLEDLPKKLAVKQPMGGLPLLKKYSKLYQAAPASGQHGENNRKDCETKTDPGETESSDVLKAASILASMSLRYRS